MRIESLHRWDLTFSEAIALQGELCHRVLRDRSWECLETVAGADIAFQGDRAIAAVIAYRFSEPFRFAPGGQPSGGGDLIEIERVHAEGALSFPYVPGLLSFREGPLLLDAFARLSHIPDIILFDGQGIAHPRRFGLASHMGLWLNLPTIGCAKSRLFGIDEEPGGDAGDWAPLTQPLSPQGGGKGDVIGAVLRTRTGVKPIYISIGHATDLHSAIAVVRACLDRTRIPRPTREADRLVNALAHQSMSP